MNITRGCKYNMDKWLRLLITTSSSLILILLIGIVIWLAGHVAHTLLIFSLAALLAYALDPMVEWLRRTKLGPSHRVPSREMSVAVVVLTILLIFGFGCWSLEGHLVAQVRAVHENAPKYQEHLLAFASTVDQKLAAAGVKFSLMDTIQHPPKEMKDLGARAGREVLPVLGHVFSALGESVIILLIAVYYLIYGSGMRSGFNAMLPEDLRMRVDLWQDDVNRILGSFVRGQLLIALVVGALAAVGCLILGLHLWLLIGLLVTAAALIPVFGPYLGAIPAVIAAAASPSHLHNPVAAVCVVLVYFVIINELGSKVLYPKLVGEALGLHAVLVLFVLFAGLEIAGVVGVLFAAPLTALTIVTVVHLYRYWRELPDSSLADAAQEAARRRSNKRITEKE
ncbi:MAG: AI-2E family transporter [Capsulimonas sp.]|uniref:AI-2E family transporter n=1 Tax=Capsulimonas sp. TaxID=2494211 RepID=UPI00326714DB